MFKCQRNVMSNRYTNSEFDATQDKLLHSSSYDYRFLFSLLFLLFVLILLFDKQKKCLLAGRASCAATNNSRQFKL